MARQNNVPLNGPVLLAKAENFAQDLGHQDFKVTGSWLQRFKTRKGIVSKVISGEAGAVTTEIVEGWKDKFSSL